MSLNSPDVLVPVEPRLDDRLVMAFQTLLATELSWLDKVYGKAERLKELKDKREIVKPAVYVGESLGKEYISMMPDGNIGSFCWFDFDDDGDVSFNKGSKFSVSKVSFGIVFSFDYRDVYPSDWGDRTIDNVKSDILNAFEGGKITEGSFRLLNFRERVENVYRGYSVREIDNQFAMRPYGVLRVNMEATYRQNCP